MADLKPDFAKTGGFAPSASDIKNFIAAAEFGNLLAVKKTLADHPNAASWEDSASKQTAFMRAAGKGRAEIMQTLLASGADVNKTDAQGKTALLISAANGQAAAVKICLEHGADPDKTDNLKNTALIYTAMTGKIDCAKLLLEHGARTECVGQSGNTALKWAMVNGNAPMMGLLTDGPKRSSGAPSP